MSGTIFLRDGDKLVPMKRAAFDSEDLLQTLIAKYPDLLAGDQMDSADPRRWLLVSREMGVPDEQGGSNRWSLDHLFVDQDAVPTLVEVKRSSDTRIRREVVGQILDYAANAVTHWPIAVIRATFEQQWKQTNGDPDQVVRDFLRCDSVEDEVVENFWKSMETNLQAGRVRMVLLADEIPTELQRVVEFLNEQMNPAEVLAVEVPQFVGPGLQTLVPRVVGRTAEAIARKRPGGGSVSPMSESEFFSLLPNHTTAEGVEVTQELLKWSKSNALDGRVDWIHRGFVPVFPGGKSGFCPFSVSFKGRLRVYYQFLKAYPPFNEEQKRRELNDRLNTIPGLNIPSTAISGKPAVPLDILGAPGNLRRFLEIIEWVRSEVEKRS
jgi:hypothetical protein